MLSPLIFLLCYKGLRIDHWETNHLKSLCEDRKKKKENQSFKKPHGWGGGGARL